MQRFALFALMFVAFGFPHTLLAKDVPALRINEDTRFETLLSTSRAHARADINEAGASLIVDYSAKARTQVIVLFPDASGEFDPFESLISALPSGENVQVRIDLTGSPAWTPIRNAYRIYFLSPTEVTVKIHNLKIDPARAWESLLAGARQMLLSPAYSPSLYHQVPERRVFNTSLTWLLGIMMLALAGFSFLRRGALASLAVSLSFTLLFSGISSVDALLYSLKHGKIWMTQRTYASGGSLMEIAGDLRSYGAKSVHLCHTGTTFAQKLLAYHAYPVLLNEEAPDYIVVHRATNWSFNGQELFCDEKPFRAQMVEEYADGSILLRALP